MRYTRLSKGLETAEIRFSSLKANLRLEAEFYQKKHLRLVSELKSLRTKPLRELASGPVRTGHTPSMRVSAFYGGEIRFIKTDNLRKFRITEPFTDYLSAKGNDMIAATELAENDLIVTIIGATHDIIGRCSIVRREDLPANINQNIALIRIDGNIIDPFYVCVYLNSKFGRQYLEYLSRQTAQVNLNCEEISDVPVPIMSDVIISGISGQVRDSYSKLLEAKARFKEAVDLLSADMGLDGTTLSTRPFSSFPLSASFLASGRLDAEYHMPRYSDYRDLIKRYRNGWRRLDELCEIKDSNFIPEPSETYKYIELSNIGNNGEITGCSETTGAKLPSRARRQVWAGDILVSSLEGSLQSCALVTPDFDGALCSTGFYVVKSEYLQPEALLLLFKSEPIQQLMKKGCSGTILAAIGYNEFSRIPLPLLPSETQDELVRLVRVGNELRITAARILAAAQHDLEKAISEEIALRRQNHT